MHSLNNRGVHTENLRIFPNCAPNKMDYRQKMVVPSMQKLKHQEEEDDDEDLEALRLAALKSLGAKHTLHSTQQPTLLSQQAPRVEYPSCDVYNHQRQMKRGYYQNRLPRPNGNTYYPSRVNQNLIEIIPVEEDETLQTDVHRINTRFRKINVPQDAKIKGESKFYRYNDKASGSEEEDAKEPDFAPMVISSISESERLERGRGETESGMEREKQSIIGESQCEYEDSNEHDRYEETVQEEENEEEIAEHEEVEDEEEEEEPEEPEEDEEEDEEKGTNDDDDDVLLMADLEEEDSLERLMDEMEREMNVDKHEEQNNEKKLAKKEIKETKKTNRDVSKVRHRKTRIAADNNEKNGIDAPNSGEAGSSSLSLVSSRKERRSSVSPRPVNKTLQKRRSLSPKPRLRRRSPRRSPARLPNKSFRDVPRARSPRKLSPVLRLSPRRSPMSSNNRSSPLRKLSPRATSPPLPPPHSRSPRIRRSRSPRRYSRSRSPKRSDRSRSPRQIVKSRSPTRASPIRIMKLSPRATTPRSISPRSSSPPVRRASPRRVSPRPMRSPKLSSPAERRRLTPPSSGNRLRSPGRSPWSSPRNSPRLSPRRRRSPKESRSRKPMRGRSLTPEEGPSLMTNTYKRQVSPLSRKTEILPDIVKSSKDKQKEPIVTSSSGGSGGSKESTDVTNNPILEARRRKFECTKPIDPINDNKKIKLVKKENTSKIRVAEQIEPPESPKNTRKKNKLVQEDYEMPESDLCLTEDYVYDVVEDVASDASTGTNTISMCVEMVPVKVEKERTKKKKKRDKELYQAGKLKGELPLSERLGKEKKCKKRKERVASPIESSPEQQVATVDDMTVDEEADLRTELSRRRAERLNRAVPIQSARLLQSAFKGVVNEVAKTNAKAIQRHAAKGEDKINKKEVRRVTVLHRTITDMPDSEDEAIVDSKVPIRFRLGINKPAQEVNRESKATRKSSKRSGRKVKHKNNMSMTDHERKN